jgi:hypothetical protein
MLAPAFAQDVLSITQIQASEGGQARTSFLIGQSVDTVIFIENDANTGQSSSVRLQMTNVDSRVDVYDRTQAFNVAANSSTTVGFTNIDLNSLSVGSYVFTATIPQVGNEYRGNNSRKHYVAVVGPRPINVDSSHPFLAVLTAFSVLFLISKRK